MNNEEENKEGRINTMENVILNNKLECPVVGIGTFMLAALLYDRKYINNNQK